MGGGLMQLVAYGAQDVYLTGNPQITFWKVVYRRHTNFSMEAVEHTLNGNPDFGRSSTVTILRNGDLAGRILLKVQVDVVAGSANTQVAWVRRLGHALVREVECEIGGSRIDRQFGVWMDIFWELSHTTSKERGYRAMIGDVPTMTTLTNAGLPQYTMYIPLQFWFNRNAGLALPLIALQYHEVRLNFEFEEVNNLLVWSGAAPAFSNFRMRDASILVDYVYLDSEERRRFAQVGHEYLIEQLQFTGIESVTGSNMKFKLGFNHPCKEIVWALRNGAFNGSASRSPNAKDNRFLAYTNGEDWSVALQAAANNIANGMVWTNKSTISKTAVVKALPVPTSEATCFQTQLSNGTVVTVSVDIDGDDCSNVSTSNSNLEVYLVSNPLGQNGSFDLGSMIGAFDLKVSLKDGKIANTNAVVTEHSLTLEEVSVPLKQWSYDNRSKNSDVNVVQLNNYGVRLDGSGNPVKTANIQLNGHDRFDPMPGAYFNYVQPDAHHTRTPADGVNVYSFALHPEQHQPSGTANLSRIDNTLLVVEFADPARNTANASFDLFAGSNLYVFATNYNVLRIMSGMGGLAYSN